MERHYLIEEIIGQIGGITNKLELYKKLKELYHHVVFLEQKNMISIHFKNTGQAIDIIFSTNSTIVRYSDMAMLNIRFN